MSGGCSSSPNKEQQPWRPLRVAAIPAEQEMGGENELPQKVPLCHVDYFSAEDNGGPADSGRGFLGGTSDKEPACQCRRHKRCNFNAYIGRISWRRKWQPPPIFCLENPMDRGAWQATVHGVPSIWTWLKWLSMHTHSLRKSFSPPLLTA